jgi:hypothetical protein
MSAKENGTPDQEGADLVNAVNAMQSSDSSSCNQVNAFLDRRRRIAEVILSGSIIRWKDGCTAFIECPGKHLHTTGTQETDCWLKIDGFPTIYCFHKSCVAEVADQNIRLRHHITNECLKFLPALVPSAPSFLTNAQAEPKARLPFQAVPLPRPIPNSQAAFLKTLFKPDEHIAVARECPRTEQSSGKKSWKPDRSKTFKHEELLCLSDLSTHQFFRVNPMSPNGTRDKDVAAFRHVLVEMDADDQGQQIPLDVQYGALLASQLPIASIVYSGNKSLHATVRVDAANEEEFDQRKAIAYANIDRFVRTDPKVGNPSRLSRLPGVFRNVKAPGQSPQHKEQSLLALNVGPSSWAEYEDLHPEEDSSLERCCYTATQQQSNSALQQQSNEAFIYHATVDQEIAVDDLLPKDGKSHDSVSQGKENCLWRLCRRLLKFAEAKVKVDEAAVFERWYQDYQRWAITSGIEAEPLSLLRNLFLMTRKKCKVPEGETILHLAWKRAQVAELPDETMPIRDDPKTCLLVAFAKEVAILSDGGGRFFVSSRDITKVTGLFSHTEANRRLKVLVELGILLCIHPGFSGPRRKSAEYVYRPINEPF